MSLHARRSPTLRARRSLSLRLERLEHRFMLSLPTVTDLNVSGTTWSSSFVDYLESASLGADGYRIPVGSSSQLQTLPWNNVDQIRITFSENVDVQAADLSVSGVNQTAYAFEDFSYDAAARTAVWTLADPVNADKLLLDLDANGVDPVQDVDESNVLDGEWTDSSDTYPSGNGTAGGDFQFRLNVLAGDADGSTGVNVIDYSQIGMKNGKNAGDEGYSIRHDVNANGSITMDDYYACRANLNHVLPSGNPAGLSNDAPTTTGIANVNVNEDAANVLIDLFAAFADAEDADAALTYQVLSNSNASLFDSAAINSTAGTLTLDFAANAFGTSHMVVRATDTGGLFVDAAFDVQVNSVNDAPVITTFGYTQLASDEWTFRGTVTDVDDSVTGLTVDFGEVLAPYNVTATVQADGTFSVTQVLNGLQAGTATAWTFDTHNLKSNVATCDVAMS
jgi:hypothetical protein